MSRRNYARWLRAHERGRRHVQEIAPEAGLFSLLTCVWDGSPPDYLAETAASLEAQTWPLFEWVVLDNGTREPALRAALDAVAQDPRVQLVRSERNLGILAGLRRCLETAKGRYVLPFDADDVLLPDALHVLAWSLTQADWPALAYSDEDVLAHGRPTDPYLRPDWDPVLNLCTSYVFHLCAFCRLEALKLGVYGDPRIEWTQDWDAVTRFAAAGHRPLHVPGVLYHWRAHERSSTNQPTPERGSLESQRVLLEREIARRDSPELYSLEPWPISRGVDEWWIRRRRMQPQELSAVVLTSDRSAGERALERLRTDAVYEITAGIVVTDTGEMRTLAATLPGELLLVQDAQVELEGDEWPWEALRLLEFHDDVSVVAGRVVDSKRRVVVGGQIFGFQGAVGSPDRGLDERDGAYWGIALKQRSVSAPHSSLFLAQRTFLADALASLPPAATFALLGPWAGAEAFRQDRRVAFTPLFQAVASPDYIEPSVMGSEGMLLRRHVPELLPDTRWYSPFLDRSSSYGLGSPR